MRVLVSIVLVIITFACNRPAADQAASDSIRQEPKSEVLNFAENAASLMQQAAALLPEDGTKKPAEAAPLLSEAMILYSRAGEHGLAFEAFTGLSQCFARVGPKESLDPNLILPVLNLYQPMSLKNRACVHKDLGAIYARRREYDEAERHLLESMDRYRSIDDQQHFFDVQRALARIQMDQGNMAEAVTLYRANVDLAKQLNSRRTLGLGHYDLGRALFDRQPEEAIVHYEAALPHLSKMRLHFLVTVITHNIASIKAARGDPHGALQVYNQTAVGFRDINSDFEGRVYLDMGNLFAQFGEHSQALAQYRIAEEHFRKPTAPKSWMGLHAMAMGHYYRNLGDSDQAWNYYEKARDVISDSKELSSELHRAMGALQLPDDPSRALDYYQTALYLAGTDTNDSLGTGLLIGLAAAREALGNYEEAQCLLDQALVREETLQHRDGESEIHHLYAALHLKQNNLTLAHQHALQALSLERSIDYRQGEVQTMNLLAAIQRAEGKPHQALSTLTEALGLVESMRAGLEGRHQRASYLAHSYDTYEQLIELCMDLAAGDNNYAARALEFSERAHARTLLDLLQSLPDTATAETELVGNMQQIRLLMESKKQYRSRLTNRQAQAALDGEIEDLLARFRLLEAQYYQLNPIQTANPVTAAEIMDLLDQDTHLLAYSLGRKRSFLWHVTHTHIRGHILPPRTQLQSAVRRALDLLNSRNQHPSFETPAERTRRIAETDAAWPTAAEHLTQMLLSPVLPQIVGKRLVIAADGVLHRLPFGPLPYPTGDSHSAEPLLVRHEITYVPSASVMKLLRHKKPAEQYTKTLAVFADPVFGKQDSRLPFAGARPIVSINGSQMWQTRSQNWENLQRLPYTGQEADHISNLLPPDLRDKHTDFDATLQQFQQLQPNQYRIIHLATHATIDPQIPELSGFIFTRVDRQGNAIPWMLSLEELYRTRLDAELVVASACSTALGREMRGEGLIGLTRGFMNAGVPRVVASLWNVQDQATAELMGRFYKHMLQQNLSPSLALRAARLELRSTSTEWSSPYYWGAFVSHGSW